MKILLVNKFHYIKGGSETYYFGLAELLRQKGHEVIFFSMKDKRNFPCGQQKYFVENVDFNAPMSKLQMLKAAKKMLYSKEAKRKFEQLLIDEKPDIIHLNIFQSQLTGSIVDVARKYGIPMVYTAHDLKSVCPNYQMMSHGKLCEKCLSGDYGNCYKEKCMKDSALKSLLATLEANTYKRRKTYSKIDYVITPSHFYKEKIEQSKIFGCKIECIPNFLSDSGLYASEASVGDYFLYFGRLSREKGVITLIKAYSKLNTERKLYIVGTGPIENQAKALVSELRLEDKVIFTGFQSGDALKKLVNEARCVILPSEWYENGPYSAMEAMAAGKILVVSRNGGLPELVSHGITGFIFEPCNDKELTKSLESVELMPDARAREMSLDNIRRAKQMFDKDKYYDELIKIYSGLCKEI